MTEKAGIVIEIKDDDLKGHVQRLGQADKQAQAAERSLRNLAKGLAEAAKAQQLLNDTADRSFKNVFGGIAEAAHAAMEELAREAKAAEDLEKNLAKARNANTHGFTGRGEDKSGDFRAVTGASQEVEKIGGALESLGPVAATVGSALGIAAVGVGAIGAAAAAAGVGLFAFVEHAAAAREELFQLSKRTDTSVAFLSGLKFEAQHAGIGFEDLSTALLTLEARAVNSEKNFTKWGIAVRNASGEFKSTEEIVRAVSDRMSESTSASERAAIGMDTLGRGGKALNSFLAVGSEGLTRYIEEAGKFGAVTDEASVALSHEFNVALHDAETLFGAIGKTIATDFMPTFTAAIRVVSEVLQSFLGYIRDNKKAITEFAVGAVQIAATGFSILAKAISIATYAAEGLVSIFSFRLSGAFTGARKLIDGFADASEKFAETLGKSAAITESAVVPAVEHEKTARAGLTAQLSEEAKARAKLLEQSETAATKLIEASADLDTALSKASGVTPKERTFAEVRKEAEALKGTLDASLRARNDYEAQANALAAEASTIRQGIKEAEGLKLSAVDQLLLGKTKEQLLKDAEARLQGVNRARALAEKQKTDSIEFMEKNAEEAKRIAKELLDARDREAKLHVEIAKKAEDEISKFLDDRAKYQEGLQKKQSEDFQRYTDKIKANASSERDLANGLIVAQTRLNELRAKGAITADVATKQSAELQKGIDAALTKSIADKAKSGPLGLISAWAQYFSAIDHMSGTTKETITKDLSDATTKMAETLASGAIRIFDAFRAERAKVGQIEEDTVQKIAVKSKDGKVIQYLQSASKAQIEQYRAMGRTVEVVNETMAIRTRTSAEAMKAAFKSLKDAVLRYVGEMLVKLAVIAVIAGAISALTGGAGGFAGGALGGIKAVLGLRRGGVVPQYLASGGLAAFVPRGSDTVPAMLTPGERILSVDQNKNFEKLIMGLSASRGGGGRYASGGVVSSRPASSTESEIGDRLARIEEKLGYQGAGATVKQTNVLFGGSQAELTKFHRDTFSKAQKQLARLAGKKN